MKNIFKPINITILILILNIKMVWGQGFTEAGILNIKPLSKGASVWADFNNDGKLDLLTTGIDENGTPRTILYENTDGSHFIQLPETITGVYDAKIVVGDLNTDNLLDLLIWGRSDEGEKFLIYINDKTDGLKPLYHEINILYDPEFKLADLTNNGKAELIITGASQPGAPPVLKIFEYKNGELNEMEYKGLPSMKPAIIVPFDFTKDSKTDLLLSGKDESGKTITGVFINKGNLQFELLKEGLTPIADASADIGDFNEDGWVDIIICGTDEHRNPLCKLYYYHEKTFVSQEIDFQHVNQAKVRTGDMNNDGKMDFIISGYLRIDADVLKPVNLFYLNKGEGFQLEDDLIEPLEEGYITIGDYDNDGGLDIFQSGVKNSQNHSIVWTNNAEIKNVPPGYPCSSFSVIKNDTVIFFWTPATDNSTSQKSLTYAISIFSEDKEAFIASPQINEKNRLLVAHGQQSMNTVYKLWGIDFENYVWNVEAIDNSYKSSAGEEKCPACPVLSTTLFETIEVCKNEMVELASERLEGKTVEWHSENKGLLHKGISYEFKAHKEELIVARIISEDGCSETYGYQIKIKKHPIIEVGEDRSVCLGEETILGGNPTAHGIEADLTYEWSHPEFLDDPTSPNPVAKPDKTTKFTLIVKSEECTYDPFYVTVTVNEPPHFGEKLTHTINAGESVVLSVPEGTSYKWSPSDGLDNDEIRNPEASPLVTTTYTVEITNANGCTGEIEVDVIVKYGFFMPNLFSPNNDGLNDTFRAYGFGINRLVLQVFNRSGQLLYESSGISDALEAGWNGQFNGKDQPNGTYIWSISGEFHDGSPIDFEGKNSGKLTLIR